MRIFNHIYFFPVNSIACLRINHVQINLFKLVLNNEEVLYVVGLIVNDAFAEKFAHNRQCNNHRSFACSGCRSL